MANGAWRGNLSQTAIDRKPLQTDKLTGRAFDDEVYAVVAQIPAGKIVSYKQIARQAEATYLREKFGIPHQNRYLRIIPHTLRTYCGGQYSPPGMRLSGKSTA